jgi:hypothetical protein
MPHKIHSAKVGPMALLMEVEFLDRLHEPVRDKKAPSVSAIIRTALERYDFTHMVVVRPSQVAMSVRLPVDIRRNLKRIARTKHTSVGQLVRTAVEAYLPQLETEVAGQLEMPIVAPAPVESALSPAQPRKKRKKAAARPKHRPVAKAKPKGKTKSKARPGPFMTKKRKG